MTNYEIITAYLQGICIALISYTCYIFLDFLYYKFWHVGNSNAKDLSRKSSFFINSTNTTNNNRRSSALSKSLSIFRSAPGKDLTVKEKFNPIIFAFSACLTSSSFLLWSSDCSSMSWVFHLLTLIVASLHIGSGLYEVFSVVFLDIDTCLTEFPVSSIVLLGVTNIFFQIILLAGFLYPIYVITKRANNDNEQMSLLARRAMKYTFISVCFSIVSYILIATHTTNKLGYAMWYLDISITLVFTCKAITPPAKYQKEKGDYKHTDGTSLSVGANDSNPLPNRLPSNGNQALDQVLTDEELAVIVEAQPALTVSSSTKLINRGGSVKIGESVIISNQQPYRGRGGSSSGNSNAHNMVQELIQELVQENVVEEV
eukprot:Pgem_evm1s19294